MRRRPPFQYQPSSTYRLTVGHVCAGYLQAGRFFRGSTFPAADQVPDGHLQGDILSGRDGAPFAQLQGDSLRLLRPAHAGIVYVLQRLPASSLLQEIQPPLPAAR